MLNPIKQSRAFSRKYLQLLNVLNHCVNLPDNLLNPGTTNWASPSISYIVKSIIFKSIYIDGAIIVDI